MIGTNEIHVRAAFTYLSKHYSEEHGEPCQDADGVMQVTGMMSAVMHINDWEEECGHPCDSLDTIMHEDACEIVGAWMEGTNVSEFLDDHETFEDDA